MRIEIPTPESWLFTLEYPVLLADVNHTHLAAVSVLPIATEVQMRLFRQLGFPEALSSDRLAGACYIMADAGLVFRSEAYYGDLLQVKVGLGDVGRGYRKHYAYPIFSQHTLDLRRWHPSPPIPSHFAVNSPQIHQFSAF